MTSDARVNEVIHDFYERHYSSVVATANGSAFERYMHQSMERRYGPDTTFRRVLEVGGNQGEHVPYVRHGYEEYVLTDLYLPQPEPTLLADRRLQVAACDVTAMPYDDASFNRVISTCLLHHVPSPWQAVEEMRRITQPGGVITILVPTDPGFAYRAGKQLTSGRKARQAGVSDEFRFVSAIDHRNHFRSIRTQIVHGLRGARVSVAWRPLRVPSMDLNAFAVFSCVV